MEVMFSAKVHDVNVKVVDVGKDALPTITVNLVNRGTECIADAQQLLNLLGKRVIASLVEEQGDLPFQEGQQEAGSPTAGAGEMASESRTGAEEGNPD